MINERRRSHPSISAPFIFIALEITMAWLILGIVEWNMNVLLWNDLTYAGALVWMFYLLTKLIRVLERQNEHNQNQKFI